MSEEEIKTAGALREAFIQLWPEVAHLAEETILPGDPCE